MVCVSQWSRDNSKSLIYLVCRSSSYPFIRFHFSWVINSNDNSIIRLSCDKFSSIDFYDRFFLAPTKFPEKAKPVVINCTNDKFRIFSYPCSALFKRFFLVNGD